MSKKLVYVVVDLDVYVMTLSVMDLSERTSLDNEIDEQGNVKTWVDFVREIEDEVLVGEDQETVDDVKDGLDQITKMMDVVDVEESFVFADGEQGLGFYAIVNDENNTFYDGQIEDYLETGA